ncbi:MAG: hypothetical protein K0R71_2048 [Bacillales bacterium]|jgi:hypothetical protein|nr:hypothetical protein [Bacillales bacterium]
MEHEDIKSSLDKIKPDRIKKQMIWGKVLSKSQKKETLNIRKLTPVFAIGLTIVVSSSILFYNLSFSNDENAIRKPESDKSRNSFNQTNTIESMDNTTDSIMMVSQFQFDKKYYILADEGTIKSFGFSKTIHSKDIGKKITTISSTDNSELKGCDVFEYVPAKSTAIVVVKIDSEYKFYKFIAFQSYWNNQDEDATDYLKLHGINESSDIERIQFISHDEQSKINGTVNIKKEISDTVEIKKFYDLYSVIKNGSDLYFNKLMGAKPQQAPVKGTEDRPINEGSATVAPDQIPSDSSSSKESDNNNSVSSSIVSDQNTTTNSSGKPIVSDSLGRTPVVDLPATTGSTEPSQGSVGDAFSNSVIIRIIAKSGIYYDAEYYPNIGFISRQQVTEQLKVFLKGYTE